MELALGSWRGSIPFLRFRALQDFNPYDELLKSPLPSPEGKARGVASYKVEKLQPVTPIFAAEGHGLILLSTLNLRQE